MYRPNIDETLCFVLLPLRIPFLGYFEKIIKPAALEVGLSAMKADDIYGTRAVMSDIWEHIWRARAVVAIVTGRNPNVNYELGICHSLGVPTVLISEKPDDVPFDYRHRRYIPYRTKDAGWEQKLRDDITKTLKATLSVTADEDELPWPYDTFDLDANGRIGRLVTAESARQYVAEGAEVVSRAMTPAFGSSGNRVSVNIPELGRQMALSRGVRIAERIVLGDPLKAQGAKQMERLSHEVLRLVGDFTKTGIFLSSALLKEGNSLLSAGLDQTAVLSGMQRAVDTATANLMTEARPVTNEGLMGVALSACAFDNQKAKAVVEAIRRAGKDGIIQIANGSSDELQVEVQEGMHFDRGYLSPFFITDPERQECVLENCHILIFERPISSMKDLLPLLEQVARSERPLLIISQDVGGEALSTLVVNKQRGTLLTAAVKAAGMGDSRAALLEDISILTNGKAFLEESGTPLDAVRLADLGRAKKVIVTKDKTTIIGGAGSTADISNRIRELRMRISTTNNPYDSEKLKERLAGLGGAIATIKPTGRTDEDLQDSQYRLGSAVSSCRSAIENGYVIGGGVALYRAKLLIERLITNSDSEKAGIQAVSEALSSPIREIMENSKYPDLSAAMKSVAEAPDGRLGFNSRTGRLEDLGAAGVLDPAKSLSETLNLAFAYAQGILKTAAWDSDDGRQGTTGSDLDHT